MHRRKKCLKWQNFSWCIETYSSRDLTLGNFPLESSLILSRLQPYSHTHKQEYSRYCYGTVVCLVLCSKAIIYHSQLLLHLRDTMNRHCWLFVLCALYVHPCMYIEQVEKSFLQNKGGHRDGSKEETRGHHHTAKTHKVVHGTFPISLSAWWYLPINHWPQYSYSVSP